MISGWGDTPDVAMRLNNIGVAWAYRGFKKAVTFPEANVWFHVQTS
ncbi:MAG: hypothetical protein GY757_58855 [bacterium]|nr:hypothetical protein [bacterium]